MGGAGGDVNPSVPSTGRSTCASLTRPGELSSDLWETAPSSTLNQSAKEQRGCPEADEAAFLTTDIQSTQASFRSRLIM